MSIDASQFQKLFPEIASHCDQAGLDALLSAMTEQTFSEGEVVVSEGEVTGDLYLVVEGVLVNALSDGDNVIEMNAVTAGGSFGKINLLDPGPAAMTVTANSDVVLLVLSHDAFRQLENDHLQMTGNILRMLSDELVSLCSRMDKALFNKSAGITDESEHHKHSGLTEWATHVFKKSHG